MGGSQSSWELPNGTLQKGCGPYQVQAGVGAGVDEWKDVMASMGMTDMMDDDDQ